VAKVKSDEPKTAPRTGWVRQFTDRPLPSFRFARSSSDILISGVAGGLGERWGVDPVVVRIAFVVTSFAGAIGVVLYLTAWWIALEPGDRRAPKPRERSMAQNLAFGAFVLGGVMLLREGKLWLGDSIGIPLLIGSVGAAVVFLGAGRERRGQARPGREAPVGRPSLWHLLAGAAFVIGGVVWFLVTNQSFGGFISVVVAVAVTSVGLAIVFGPWIFRMANQLGAERRDRMRSEDRAELAAHLHDSVLQTLALIQRNAASPRKMANLARRQERELRLWLYGQPEISGRLEAAVHEMTDAIEEAHEVTIEVVIVGDCDLDDRTMPVVQACREAATNAARHSGVDEIAVYMECEAHELTAFVRDRGNGFDPSAIDERRRGITDSIRGRIERQGGTVTITSAPGEGCEVQIVMPLGGQA
jgi:signal transduction histidine kinase/phage shock protein PspC (stress-responsive transcriptional regulator)